MEYNSPTFLDCCGLVRRVLRDLKEDFGFTIGPWNQAYQFDTLPIVINEENDMKPGDLVFISGIYNDPKRECIMSCKVRIMVQGGRGRNEVGICVNDPLPYKAVFGDYSPGLGRI